MTEDNIDLIKTRILNKVSTAHNSQEQFSSETINRHRDAKLTSVLLKSRHPREIK